MIVTEKSEIPHDRWKTSDLYGTGTFADDALSEELIDDNSRAELRDKLEKWSVLELAMKHGDQLVVVKHSGVVGEAESLSGKAARRRLTNSVT